VSTVLIAAPEHLQALKERDEFIDAQVFSDAEALRALEVITRKRPDVVALERGFASTTRGAALINRIKGGSEAGDVRNPRRGARQRLFTHTCGCRHEQRMVRRSRWPRHPR
jgi:hypothetical protein